MTPPRVADLCPSETVTSAVYPVTRRVMWTARVRRAGREPAAGRPPMLFVVMDESCLHQQVGGPEVMDAQLQRLEEMAGLPNWIIQVAPFSLGARRAFYLPVNLLTLADRSIVAYAESQAQGHVERETSFVVPLLTSYHQFQSEALSKAASVAKISQLRKGTP
ncbi:Scr1 family TA system antitoxin-like transcriptional regulator [Streptomyces sundarbansensis]